MIVLPDPTDFEWDEGNRDKSEVKHKVKIKEAEEVFINSPLIKKDEKHSRTEQRYQLLGETNNKRLLFLSFTIRQNKIRVISVRDMNKKERREYEKNKTNSTI